MYSNGAIKIKGRIFGQDRFKIFGKVEYAGPIEEIFCLHSKILLAYVS